VTSAAVVLAAGSGSRFRGAGHKLLAPIGGSTLIEAALRPALEAGLDEVIVVTGAVDLDRQLLPEVTVAVNEAWRAGLASSLRVACAVASTHGHDAIVVGLGDQPGLPGEAWRSLAASGYPIAVATYDGRRGHPVRLSSEVWPLLPVSGDAGARTVISLRPELVGEVPCRGRPADIDTVEDLDRWS
jgi:CTP:molybdopterin cytidylyltransferase MocA